MKKVLTSILSFALILVMGFAVGCSDEKKINYTVYAQDIMTGLKIERKGNDYVLSTSDESVDAAIKAGFKLIVKATSGAIDDYDIYIDNLDSPKSSVGRMIVITFTGAEVNVKIETKIKTDGGETLSPVEFKITYKYTPPAAS